MKYLIPILFLICLAGLYAQTVNLNPDPHGDPWYACPLRPLTADDYAMLDRIPRLRLPADYDVRHLRNRVDNSTQPWFRPIFVQDGGSCSQSCGVGYAFTYEIDRLRNLPADNIQNQYPTHFTYNFLNRGTSTSGSWYFDGWAILSALGCPDVGTYGGTNSYGGVTRWVNGSPVYATAMQNRANGFSAIDVGNPEGLNTLKQWFNDHLNGSPSGGIAVFSTGITGATFNTLPAGTPYAGSHCITAWGSTMDHGMTFVGYDDSICWDYNGDGQYTNDVDINGDQTVNMLDWEMGALIVANSWGTGWGNNGFSYMMYRLLSEDLTTGGIWNHIVHVVHPLQTYQPQLVMKATVRHTSRNKLRISAGVAADADAQTPDEIAFMPMFNYQGGNLPMQGNSAVGSDTLQFELDISPLISHMNTTAASRIFLIVDETDPTSLYSGEIIRCSVLIPGSGAEIVCPVVNNPLVNNGRTTASVLCNPVQNAVQISTAALPPAIANAEYIYQLQAAGGTMPYRWIIGMPYAEQVSTSQYAYFTGTTLVPDNLDDGAAYLELPFSFPFYGNTYNSAFIMTDGSIVFADSPVLIRNAENLKSQICITPYGGDLMIFTNQNHRIAWQLENGNLVIDWRVARYDNQTAIIAFQAVLAPDGNISFRYDGGITPSGNWVCGISDGSRDNYQILPYSGDASFTGSYCIDLSAPHLPPGMSISETGVLHTDALPADAEWNLNIKVADANRVTDTGEFVLSTHTQSAADVSIPDIRLRLFPNPFSPKHPDIRLSLESKSACQSRIALYDIKGRRISILWEGRLKPGHQQLKLNTGELMQSNCPTGIYILKTFFGENEAALKVLMMK